MISNELRQAIEKIIKLSDESTLCVHYTTYSTNDNGFTMSFKVEEKLNLTERADLNSFSLWNFNENISTPNLVTINLDEIESFEFLTEEQMNKKSDGLCSMPALVIKLKHGELTIFEDVC